MNRDGVTGELNSAFTSDLAALTLSTIDKEECKIIGISVAADVGSDTEVDGSVLKSGSANGDFIADKQASLGYNFARPIYAEGSTSGPCTVSITYFGNQK